MYSCCSMSIHEKMAGSGYVDYSMKTSLHDATITLGHEPEGIVRHAENRIALNSDCYCNDLYTLLNNLS